MDHCLWSILLMDHDYWAPTHFQLRFVSPPKLTRVHTGAQWHTHIPSNTHDHVYTHLHVQGHR